MKTQFNLLIVDDDPTTRLLLGQIFAQLGYKVTSASDGFTALDAIRRGMPDVIVSDLNMPGMSGFELLSVVRRRLPGIYVIATSGAYAGDRIPRGIAADAFYEKASNLKTLLKLMDVATEGARTEARGELVPIWIPPLESDGEELRISCPECMRVFPQEAGEARVLIHDTLCPNCEYEIQYAIVQPLDPSTSQPYGTDAAGRAPGAE